jgi:hypothetical protein
MKKALILLLLVTTSITAQNIEDTGYQTVFSYTITKVPTDNSHPVGSQFLNDYQDVKINGSNEDIKGKYNAYKDYFELKKGQKIVYVAPSNKHIEKIHITSSNKTYMVFKYHMENKTTLGFFKINSKLKNNYLLVKEETQLLKAITPITGYSKHQPAKFKKKSNTYYIKFSENKFAIKLPKTQKKFFKVFESKASKIKNLVKSKNLNIKSEKDLVTIFNYFSSI